VPGRLSGVEEDRSARVERAYARLEATNEVRKAATVRRGPVSLVAVCLGVALVVGVTAAVDLRRLRTPEGSAVAFAGAAVFGDCTAYRDLAAGGLDDDQCRALRDATEDARERPGDVEVRLASVETAGSAATAVVDVVRQDRDRRVVLALVRRGDRWAVQPDAGACAVLFCP
jgi:hypothetical protein